MENIRDVILFSVEFTWQPPQTYSLCPSRKEIWSLRGETGERCSVTTAGSSVLPITEAVQHLRTQTSAPVVYTETTAYANRKQNKDTGLKLGAGL